MFRNSVGNLLQQSVNKDKLNILCAITHERYEGELAKTNHNFYGMHRRGIFKEKWNQDFGPVPENYYLLNENFGEDQVPFWLDFNVCLSQNKFGQFQILSQIAKNNNLPLISLEHTCSMEWWNKQQKAALAEMRGVMNVFISYYSLDSWGWKDRGDTKVIYHGVDNELFKPDDIIIRKNHILEVANDYIGRDSVLNFSQFKRVVIDNGLPYRAVGDTKGFSNAPKNVSDLANEYKTSRIFVNTHHVSPIPTSLLEAAASACGIVSCNTCGIPEIFTHGVDALLYNNDEEMLKYLTMLLNDEAMAIELGNNARKTIMKKCDPKRFVEEWNQVFNHVASF